MVVGIGDSGWLVPLGVPVFVGSPIRTWLSFLPVVLVCRVSFLLLGLVVVGVCRIWCRV